MKCGSMPSLSHQADSRVRPPAPVEPNGAPLSQRIARGSPWRRNARTNTACDGSIRGATIRTSIRNRLWPSLIVRGSIRQLSPVRNQPLKSTAHSSFAASTGIMMRPWSSGGLRRLTGVTKPSRLRMSPIVEAAGQLVVGACRSSIHSSLRGPKCGKRRRSATIVATRTSSVACGQCCTACERSPNHAVSPLSRRLRHS